MVQHEMVRVDELENISNGELAARYDDVVEATWHYLEKIRGLTEENEDLTLDYEKVSDQLYG